MRALPFSLILLLLLCSFSQIVLCLHRFDNSIGFEEAHATKFAIAIAVMLLKPIRIDSEIEFDVFRCDRVLEKHFFVELEKKTFKLGRLYILSFFFLLGLSHSRITSPCSIIIVTIGCYSGSLSSSCNFFFLYLFLSRIRPLFDQFFSSKLYFI